ncbi:MULTISPECIES: hypothetical protein [Bifidobacterium]|jgi:hypothetical protein|uniref:Uncharacterized protein n=2 Tax=Bifidobacterium TaxID=1678 RepID=A0A087DTJ4_9BIFI|nr:MULTISPECIES: hypothetical protein [Bifidobacterium]KAE8128702.1 hypothetical protein DDE84_04355 [Bifidobacterium tibiigranuli]KAE8128893.1 hypothetical protein DDF78_04145 [Bifidobacterium tibiigranuli]KFI98844.1 hypothetical protein BISU_2046 [Bifidobacterium subtile]MCH4190626.1 hypothetical protein [Bifidobacterium tibiigranuli]QOL36466.1 hypothetical protein BS3272_00120 [Bifidobacterium subtile]
MAGNDEVWRWDDSQAVEYTGADAQEHADRNLMAWTGAASPEEAAAMLLGRPGMTEQREESQR